MGAIAIDDEAHWLSVRESNVGGSEVASLFYRWRYPDGSEVIHHMYEQAAPGAVVLGCLNPFRTGYRMWFEKAGLVMPDDLSGNERVQSGIYLEPAIAEWAKAKWSWSIRKVRRYLVHNEVQGWGASLDFEAVGKGYPPVEIKNTDGAVVARDWTVDGEDILLPPIHYLLQVQHQIGACGADHGWIVACVSGSRLLRGRIERHEPTQERISAAIAAFWEGVRARVEPTWVADYESAAKAHLGGEKGSAIDLTADDELPALCREYTERKQVLTSLEGEVEMLKGRIAAKVGDNSKATAQGFRISWPLIERAEKVIPERIQKAALYRGALTITATGDKA